MPKYFSYLLFVLATLGLFSNMLPACEGDAWSDDKRLSRFSEPIETSDGKQPSFAEERKIYVERFRDLWCENVFDGPALAQASDEDLLIRLRAAGRIIIGLQDDWILQRFHAALSEAHSREIAETGAYYRLFHGYLAASDEEAARKLRRAFPEAGLPKVPDRIEPPVAPDDPARLLWSVDGDSDLLKGKWLEINQARLVVFTTPNCGFCRLAAKELSADETLGPLMREHALWLSYISISDTFWRVAEWNQEFPDSATHFVDDPEDWPYLDLEFLARPTFYFVDGDDVRKTLVGFSGGEQALKKIAKGFAEIGLLDHE